MANTFFVDETGVGDGTPLIAAWHNDINNVVYNLLGNGVTVPTTQEQLRANIGTEIGSDVQAWSSTLDTLSLSTPTAAGLAILEAADAAAQRVAMGVEIDVNVQSALFTATIDRFFYVSAPGVISITQLTMAARNLLGDVDFVTMRQTLGVEIGVDVQAFSANLSNLSGFGVLDEDDLASDSDTDLVTQQSIKAYIDNNTILSNQLFFAYPTAYSDTFTTNFGADVNQLDITSVPAQILFSDLTVWRLTTTGTLPAPLLTNTNYYISSVNAPAAIEVSLTPHGIPIVLTDNGTGTHTILPLNVYTPTAGLISVTVKIIGGGGSGSGCTTTNSAGDGGGAGGGCSRTFVSSEIGATEIMTVGAGGLGTTGDGNNGAATLFGGLFTSTGGQNGSGNLQDPDTGVGGLGGIGADGDINTEGGRGMPAIASSGGGDPKAGGSGGNALFGGGGAGVFVGATSSMAVSGQPATSFGGGGGGAALDGAGSASGGNGYGGVVEIKESFLAGG